MQLESFSSLHILVNRFVIRAIRANHRASNRTKRKPSTKTFESDRTEIDHGSSHPNFFNSRPCKNEGECWRILHYSCVSVDFRQCSNVATMLANFAFVFGPGRQSSLKWVNSNIIRYEPADLESVFWRLDARPERGRRICRLSRI